MKRQQWGLYAVALAILVVGLVAVGVPVSTLAFGAMVLACPLMMLFMHRGHGGRGGHGSPGHHSASHDQHSSGAPRRTNEVIT